MAYEKQTWATGDIITAAKLNHMEDGIAAGGTLVIGGFRYDAGIDAIIGTADKTWQEIDNALAAGARCVVVVPKNDGHYQEIITQAVVDEGDYAVIGDNGFIGMATSVDGYPTNEADDDPIN